MACAETVLNYCAQCQQINTETVFNCRWLNFGFCNLKCLNKFQNEIAPECNICEEFLDYDRIYLRDDAKISSVLTFICADCFFARSGLSVNCYLCSKICYIGYGTLKLTTSGLIPKYLCASDCDGSDGNKRKSSMTMETCAKCGIHGKCAKISCNGHEYGICTAVCLTQFGKDNSTQFGTCEKCQTKYFSDMGHKYEIVEGKHRKEFCSKSCLTMHMREDTSAMSCSVCRHRMKFYDCIRRNCDNRCFCSLQCALAAETRAELLMHNDEQNLISQLALQPEWKFDAFNQDRCVLNQPVITAMDRITMQNNVAAMNVSTGGNQQEIMSRYQFTHDNLEDLSVAPMVQDPDYTMKCNQCASNINPELPYFQWEYLTFCQADCYETRMYSSQDKCAFCTEDCTSHYAVYVRIVGDQLNHFCSETCERSFFREMQFCKFCGNLVTTMNVNDFCCLICQHRYDEIYVNNKEAYNSSCYQCHSLTVPNISLLIDESVRHFCSFACYFSTKTICGIFPEQCTICQIYFIRNPNEIAQFVLRNKNKLNVFCSRFCRAHYIYKYRIMQKCSVCCRRKSSFNMVKIVTSDMSIEVDYCSMQCWQIVDQSIQLENYFRLAMPEKNFQPGSFVFS